jgi:hypothetical protein
VLTGSSHDHRSFPVDGQPVGSAAKLVEALVGCRHVPTARNIWVTDKLSGRLK